MLAPWAAFLEKFGAGGMDDGPKPRPGRSCSAEPLALVLGFRRRSAADLRSARRGSRRARLRLTAVSRMRRTTLLNRATPSRRCGTSIRDRMQGTRRAKCPAPVVVAAPETSAALAAVWRRLHARRAWGAGADVRHRRLRNLPPCVERACDAAPAEPRRRALHPLWPIAPGRALGRHAVSACGSRDRALRRRSSADDSMPRRAPRRSGSALAPPLAAHRRVSGVRGAARPCESASQTTGRVLSGARAARGAPEPDAARVTLELGPGAVQAAPERNSSGAWAAGA